MNNIEYNQDVTKDAEGQSSAKGATLNVGLGAGPRRAVRLTLQLDADSIRDLVRSLEGIAMRVECGEMTSGGSGGYNSGYTYELLQNPEQTHDNYFAQLREYLAKKAPNE